LRISPLPCIEAARAAFSSSMVSCEKRTRKLRKEMPTTSAPRIKKPWA